WIAALYDKAWASASEEDRAAALAQASQTTAQVTGSARRRR
ncbi:MAG: Exopolysaccharide biosynthesis protein, partial [Methylobacterium sp.]|nr:Exopolysaccharide biosynthesis protein [Methylobacterium sp.]